MKFKRYQDKSLRFEEKQLILLLCIALSIILHASWQYRTEKMSVLVKTDEVRFRQVQGELEIAEMHEAGTNQVSDTRRAQLTPFFFEPVPINSANQHLLETLPGVGPAMADRIIRYRDQHGQISNIEQLRNIPGIGKKRSAQLASLISFE